MRSLTEMTAQARATGRIDVGVASLADVWFSARTTAKKMVGSAAVADPIVVGPELRRLSEIAAGFRAVADLIDVEAAACGSALREVA